jgi:hypothetical protein
MGYVVIPSGVEEWSDWGERHGPLGREGSGERVGETNEFNRLQYSRKYLEMSRLRST